MGEGTAARSQLDWFCMLLLLFLERFVDGYLCVWVLGLGMGCCVCGYGELF